MTGHCRGNSEAPNEKQRYVEAMQVASGRIKLLLNRTGSNFDTQAWLGYVKRNKAEILNDGMYVPFNFVERLIFIAAAVTRCTNIG